MSILAFKSHTIPQSIMVVVKTKRHSLHFMPHHSPQISQPHLIPWPLSINASCPLAISSCQLFTPIQIHRMGFNCLSKWMSVQGCGWGRILLGWWLIPISYLILTITTLQHFHLRSGLMRAQDLFGQIYPRLKSFHIVWVLNTPALTHFPLAMTIFVTKGRVPSIPLPIPGYAHVHHLRDRLPQGIPANHNANQLNVSMVVNSPARPIIVIVRRSPTHSLSGHNVTSVKSNATMTAGRVANVTSAIVCERGLVVGSANVVISNGTSLWVGSQWKSSTNSFSIRSISELVLLHWPISAGSLLNNQHSHHPLISIIMAWQWITSPSTPNPLPMSALVVFWSKAMLPITVRPIYKRITTRQLRITGSHFWIHYWSFALTEEPITVSDVGMTFPEIKCDSVLDLDCDGVINEPESDNGSPSQPVFALLMIGTLLLIISTNLF